MTNTKNKQSRNKYTVSKKRIWIIVIICAVCVSAAAAPAYIYSGLNRDSMKWAKNLSVEDVSCIEMVIFPQDMNKQYKVFSDEEIATAVTLINESRGRYLKNPEATAGGAITLYLRIKDGSEHTVSNIGNLYLEIDGDHFDAGYRWLSSWDYTEGDEPLPYNFFDITPTPENYAAFQAEVLEIGETTMLVEPMPGSSELNSADRFSIPLKKMPPSPEVEAGDVIEIQYNGEIQESYPAQLGEIYGTSVTTKKSADEYGGESVGYSLDAEGDTDVIADESEADSMWDRIPMVRVNDKLYYDTGKESTVSGRCGNMDGQITSEVDGSKIPTENNQSNFGTGFGYQYGEGDTIEVYMNEKWFVFEYREE